MANNMLFGKIPEHLCQMNVGTPTFVRIGRPMEIRPSMGPLERMLIEQRKMLNQWNAS